MPIAQAIGDATEQGVHWEHVGAALERLANRGWKATMGTHGRAGRTRQKVYADREGHST